MKISKKVQSNISGYRQALTLIEIVITMSILVILLVSGFIAIKPGILFKQARDNQRRAHLNAILGAIRQNIVDNRNNFVCTTGDIPTTSKRMSSKVGGYNIAPCLVPIYLYSMPFDPLDSAAYYNSVNNYDSGYWIVKNASSGQITLTAPSAETTSTISVTY
jgi:type II secretory pathway pseudopilin PulG